MAEDGERLFEEAKRRTDMVKEELMKNENIVVFDPSKYPY
jgi:hypothetical protein